MKKQGFTLIELMVVIVIMGILAAVAVPKLFGMIAKSKASEVGPAAGTYVHLQDAFFAEKEYTGDETAIGFKSPASNVFSYSVTGGGDASTASVFTATNDKAGLGDCDQSSDWTITSSTGGANGGAKHVASAPDGECEALTPSFEDIGKGTKPAGQGG